jgi:hypothetical protein
VGCSNSGTGGYWYFENQYYSYFYNGAQQGGNCIEVSGSMPDPWVTTGMNCAHYTTPAWFPLGTPIYPYGYSYDTGYPGSYSEYFTYANSSSLGGYNGPVGECSPVGGGASNCWGQAYVYYFYLAYYGPACMSVEICTFVPDVMLSPIYQTVWFLASVSSSGPQTAPQEIEPQGLPSGTPYSFTYDTTVYSAVAPSPILLPKATVGTHQITNAKASSATAGWTYYAANFSVTVPLQPFVNLTFSEYIHTSAAMVPMSFNAPLIPKGDSWGIYFNGTSYYSNTPYLNLTAHPGIYDVSGWSFTSVMGDANYTPSFKPTVNLETTFTATLSYSAIYRVSVTAPTGGLVEIGSAGATTQAYAWVASGTTVSIQAMASTGFTFQGWTGTGNGSYTGPTVSAKVTVGSPIYEAASFYRGAEASDTLTFTETTLPASTWWTIQLNGIGYSSNTNSITVANVYPCAGICGNANALGHYNLTVETSYQNVTPSQTRYIGSGPTWVSTNGTTSAIPITFTPQYLVNVQATPGGSVAVLNGQAVVTVEPFWASLNAVVTIQATPNPATVQGRWVFDSWVGTGSGNYTGGAADESGTVTVGGPITEVATFTWIATPPPPQYTLTVSLASATTLAPGTVWTITVGSTSYSSTNTTLVASGLLKGTYSFSVKDAYSTDGTTRYLPSDVVNIVTITGNKTMTLSFTTWYWVDVENTTGGAVALSTPSGAPEATSGWFQSGTQLVLTATPGAYVFKAWTGSGTGSYGGDQAVQTITVNGPVREIAAFQPPPPTATSVTEYFNMPVVWVALAIVGLVVGLAVGMLLFRNSGGSRPPSEAPAASSGGAKPEYSEEQGGEP